MRPATFVSAVALMAASGIEAQNQTTGLQGDALVVSNNPAGVVYTATLPTTQFFNPADPRGNVKGSISATAAPGGKGVAFTVNFSNLPTSGGPFLYHIHVAPVNASGSCASTLAHLDPFIRGETTPCNTTNLASCQVGDLSGKYGKITSDPFTASYVDLYASTLPGIGSFFGNRSMVVHFANTTRITCANFATVSSTTTAPSTPQYTGAASGVAASVVGIFAAAFAAVML